MFSPFIIPLACFVMVVLIVAITQLIMQELELELQQLKQGG
jgi:hypothetical protein